MTIISHEKDGVLYHAADGFERAGGVAHGFSTRRGGVSGGIWASMNLGSTRGDEPAHVLENYRRFCAAIGADARRVIRSNQVHGNVVRPVTRADLREDILAPEDYEADGLITNCPGIVLTVFSADCAPILLYDPVRQAAAAVHAGWRGTALGIAAKAAAKMTALYGSRPGDILAAIGPCISHCCFETERDVPDAMSAAMGAGASAFVRAQPGGKFHVDLKGLNAMQLEGAGLFPAHIAVDRDCTMCLPELYWSHRAAQGLRGSQAAMIALVE